MFAIAEFGSQSRKTSDQYSDKDLLVICPFLLRKKMHEKYLNEGYSVTALTPEQLVYMQKSGSLFIQHLKKEAKIIFDEGNELQKFLKSAELLHPTNAEIERCKNTISFISFWKSNSILTPWKADFLYCVTRDLIIKELAKKNILVFGLEDIEIEMMKYFHLENGEFECFYQLRRIKSAYRSGLKAPGFSKVTVNSWLKIMSKLFGIELIIVNELKNSEIVNRINNRAFNTNYEKLRCIEALYLLAQEDGFFHPDHDLLINHLINPNLYGSSQNRKLKILDMFYNDLIGILKYGSTQYKSTVNPLI